MEQRTGQMQQHAEDKVVFILRLTFVYVCLTLPVKNAELNTDLGLLHTKLQSAMTSEKMTSDILEIPNLSLFQECKFLKLSYLTNECLLQEVKQH